MTPVQRAEWRKTGKLPDQTPSTSSDAVTSAASAEPPASSDAQAAKPTDSQTVKPPKQNADTRKAQLQAEIRADLARREALRQEIAREEGRLEALRGSRTDGNRAESSPAPANPPQYTRPKPSEDEIGTKYENYAAFVEDLTDWKVEQREADAQRTQRESELTRSQSERATQFQERIKAAESADPEFAKSISYDVLSLKPFSALLPGESPSARNAIAEELLSSPVAPQLMRHFSDHPGDLRRLESLLPRELLREFGKLEARFATETPAAVQTPQAPTTKHLSSAPPPPTTLGSRPADAGDAIKSAVSRKDYTSYRDEANRRDIAAATR